MNDMQLKVKAVPQKEVLAQIKCSPNITSIQFSVRKEQNNTTYTPA